MSRVNLIEQIVNKNKRKPIAAFDYDRLAAPPLMSVMTPDDIQELISIATSIKYNANISRKYEMINAVMKRRGFIKAHAGTNRVVYHHLEDPGFVAKVAVDKVGMTDSPREYINQNYFKPFCCKIFEVHPSGVIAFVERVNPISSLDEFMSIANDVFNMMVTKIIGKYVVDDLGSRTFMNFGTRYNTDGVMFGPVIIDFPYAYELDGAKLICKHPIINKQTGKPEPCGGELDYDIGFNKLYCTKCGREYTAMELAKTTKDVEFHYDSDDKQLIKDIIHCFRARVIDKSRVIYDSGRSSNKYVSREEFDDMNIVEMPLGEIPVDKTIYEKRKSMADLRSSYYTTLQKQYYEEMVKRNPTLKETLDKDGPIEITVDKTVKKVSRDYYNYTLIPSKQITHIDNSREELVDETVDINDRNIDPKDTLINELEKVTFPELHAEIDSSVIVLDESSRGLLEPISENSAIVDVDFSDNNTDTVIVSDNIISEENEIQSEDNDEFINIQDELKVESDNIPSETIPEENVKKYAEYVSHIGDTENVSSGDSRVIDPEQDKTLIDINPMSRPYAKKPDEDISVDAKIVPDFSLINQNKDPAPNLIPQQVESLEEDNSNDIESEDTITNTEESLESIDNDDINDKPVIEEVEQPIPEVNDYYETIPTNRQSAGKRFDKFNSKKHPRDNGGYD